MYLLFSANPPNINKGAMKLDRDKTVWVATWVSVGFAVLSISTAAVIRFKYPEYANIGYILVGFWVLAPPVWFFFEWVCLCKKLPPDERDRIKHLHDLARNIWLALVIVLAAILNYDYPDHIGAIL